MEKSIKNIVSHSDVSEKEIEKYLVKQMKALGLPCLKYSNQNQTGYPDRLIVLPYSRVMWVELKSRGKKPTLIQENRMAELKNMLHDVLVIDSKAGVDRMVRDLKDNARKYIDYGRTGLHFLD